MESRWSSSGRSTILARWQAQQGYGSSLEEHDIGVKEIILFDQVALERHDYTATKAERIRCSQKWGFSMNAEGFQLLQQQRPDYEAAERECQRLQGKHMAETKQLCAPIFPSKQRRQNPNQQFEGSEDYDYVVDRKTRWKCYKEWQKGLPHTSSSSSSSRQTSSWKN